VWLHPCPRVLSPVPIGHVVTSFQNNARYFSKVVSTVTIRGCTLGLEVVELFVTTVVQGKGWLSIWILTLITACKLRRDMSDERVLIEV
jgi:hypothetical protein